MLFPPNKLKEIAAAIDMVIDKIAAFEKHYEREIHNAHPNYRRSAKNLIHYLALRKIDVDILQEKLDEIGLPNAPGYEKNILHNLLIFKTIVSSLLKEELPDADMDHLTHKEANRLLKRNTRAVFSKIKHNRRTAIMVTQPTEAATDKEFTKALLENGMDCARINCSHDDKVIWKKIIDNIGEVDKDCKIMMDLGGPKIRTGKMKPGHKVIHIKPKKNSLGQVKKPARVWLAPFGTNPPPGETADAIIPVNKKWLRKTRPGSYIVFRDSRDKKCRITIDEKVDTGRWGSCSDSAFVTTGTLLNVFLEKKSTSEIHSVHELLPLEEVIFLFEGDYLRLDRKPVLGEPAIYDEDGNILTMAHISCTLPEMFNTVNAGEPIYFDDGKIGGIIKEIQPEYLIIEITNAKKKGGKLKADKGINLPGSILGVKGLTEKDIVDLKFVAKHADVVNFSFVNNKHDVEDLLNEIKKLKAKLGIILKIETQEAFKNLPSILLKAMENYPIGVMIARGDLAIETGWKNFAIIQKEILKICDAAHLPDVWA
ncbi:MAG: hypothetical protein KJO83_02495, partial [Bacteroidia bacterium]|nr:hypothetical protein [Bacteroidia bacterium]